jgi:hypothetical protein
MCRTNVRYYHIKKKQKTQDGKGYYKNENIETIMFISKRLTNSSRINGHLPPQINVLL